MKPDSALRGPVRMSGNGEGRYELLGSIIHYLINNLVYLPQQKMMNVATLLPLLV